MLQRRLIKVCPREYTQRIQHNSMISIVEPSTKDSRNMSAYICLGQSRIVKKPCDLKGHKEDLLQKREKHTQLKRDARMQSLCTEA